MPRQRKGGDICAIFVHAGAGFHSHQNEGSHLDICENASQVAMAILRNGGSAVEAVEMALMVLEDAEMTNSGYGSNLAIDGSVECDATIVDHKGRSGAVGAVASVKNPISLAKVILDESSKPMTLQRVPPNFLVGSGATDFAFEHGLVVLPPDGLTSKAAKERWNRWQSDLQAAETQERKLHPEKYHKNKLSAYFRHPIPPLPQLAGSPPSIYDSPQGYLSPSHSYSPSQSQDATTQAGDDTHFDLASQMDPSLSMSGTATPIGHIPAVATSEMSIDTPRPADQSEETWIPNSVSSTKPEPTDRISDTVGAIAVDCHGNIAAGSSSGGIGMKHNGRIGPAALVGIGTAVLPVDASDPDKTSVATVTSGTGEHIATTLAASTSASRIYYSERKILDGSFECVTEEEAMRAVIDGEFMGTTASSQTRVLANREGHPGVRASNCQGAIGIMTVKKTNHGIHMYFGHNTDSFALASMSSEDKKPVSVMSRSSGNGSIAQGGRACRHKRYKVSEGQGNDK